MKLSSYHGYSEARGVIFAQAFLSLRKSTAFEAKCVILQLFAGFAAIIEFAGFNPSAPVSDTSCYNAEDPLARYSKLGLEIVRNSDTAKGICFSRSSKAFAHCVAMKPSIISYQSPYTHLHV